MKLGKKLIASALCLAMLAGLAACGTGTPSTAPSTAPSSQAATSTATDKVQIDFMIWANDTEAATTQKVLDTYNASQDKIEVKLSYVPETEYVAKISTLAASNQLPDAAMGNEAVVLKWASNGLLADVSQMYAGGTAPLESLAFKHEGKTVAYSCANEVLLLYYNKAMFDEAGVAYPPASADKAWTWAEFVDTAKKLTKDSAGKKPGDAGFKADDIATYGAWVDTLAWMWPVFAISNGGGLVSEDGKEILLDKPESIEAAQAIADLYLKDKVSPAPGALADLPIDAMLSSKKVAMVTGGQWNIGTNFINPKKEGTLDYGVAVLPKFKDAVTYNTGGPTVMFQSSEHPAETMEFLKWYTQESNNWGLIETGIWMPILKDYYTDEAKTKEWADNENHPKYEDYKTAVVDYALNNAKQVPWYYLPCYSRLQEVLEADMPAVWNGDKTAKEAIDAMAPKLKEILADGKAAE